MQQVLQLLGVQRFADIDRHYVEQPEIVAIEGGPVDRVPHMHQPATNPIT
jgi:hypothetical protein